MRELPATHRFVAHEPETPRYARARQKLGYLLREGVYLGAADLADWRSGRLEIAVWAPPAQGRGPGHYGCFRLFLEGRLVTGAVLFFYYDGTESSPRLATLQDAQAYAQANGFVKDSDDEDQDEGQA